MIGCEDRLRNDLYCVEWGVKLYSNQPRSEGSPHHGRTFSIILSLSSVILIDSSTESCPRLDVVHPGRAWLSSPSCTWHCSLHYLSPGNSLVSSCFYSSFVKNPLICFLCCPRNPQNPSQSFRVKGVQTCFFILSESPAFTAVAYVATGHTNAFISRRLSSLKSVCCDFSISSAVMPRSLALCLTWYGIPSYTHHLL